MAAAVPSGDPAASASTSARAAAAMLARSLSGAVVTPSQTTSTARSPTAANAMASSLRLRPTPLSQTPAIHSTGDSVK